MEGVIGDDQYDPTNGNQDIYLQKRMPHKQKVSQ